MPKLKLILLTIILYCFSYAVKAQENTIKVRKNNDKEKVTDSNAIIIYIGKIMGDTTVAYSGDSIVFKPAEIGFVKILSAATASGKPVEIVRYNIMETWLGGKNMKQFTVGRDGTIKNKCGELNISWSTNYIIINDIYFKDSDGINKKIPQRIRVYVRD